MHPLFRKDRPQGWLEPPRRTKKRHENHWSRDYHIINRGDGTVTLRRRTPAAEEGADP